MNTKNLTLSASGLLAALALVPFASANTDLPEHNWPQWRGPTGNGVALHGNPPIEWSEEKNVKWKVAIPGAGHATPVVWGNQVFILTAIPSSSGEQEFAVLCLNRETGETIWKHTPRKAVPHEGHHQTNTYASGSPVTDGEHVWAFFSSHGLFCYDMDGNLKWQKDFGDMRTRNGFGEGVSPTLADDKLIIVWDTENESWIAAFDKLSGDEIWKQERDERTGWSTPYVLEHEGVKQVVVNGTNAVRSYDLSDGTLLWQCAGQTANAIPSVVADDEYLYAMSGFRGNTAVAIELGARGDVTDTDKVKWKLDRGTPYVPSPLLYDGQLYFLQNNNGIISSVDSKTGEIHYQQERLDGIRGVYASPVGVQDRVYIAGREGTTLVIEKGPELKVVATNELDDPIDASPVVVGDELLIRTHTHLYCIAE